MNLLGNMKYFFVILTLCSLVLFASLCVFVNLTSILELYNGYMNPNSTVPLTHVVPVEKIEFIINGDHENMIKMDKKTLMDASPYFQRLLKNITSSTININGISQEDFNIVLQLLTMGHVKYRSNHSLNSDNNKPFNVVRTLNNMEVLPQRRLYVDNLYSQQLLDPRNLNATMNITYMSQLYEMSKNYNLTKLSNGILNNIYMNWRDPKMINNEMVNKHPKLFLDYIMYFDCEI